jgi:site-specific recombinase XerD
MNISSALNGFFFSLKAEGYSKATIGLYRIMPKNLTNFLNDRDLKDISLNDLNRYFAYLRSEYVPKRQGNKKESLSGSSLQNHWKAIRCFFRWAEEELDINPRPDNRLKLPSNNPQVISLLSETEIRSLVEGTEFTRLAKTKTAKHSR